MILVSVNDIYINKALINYQIIINGWVKNRRHSNSGVSFIDVYDGSSVQTIQCVIRSNISNYKTEVLKLSIGCSVSIMGNLVYSIGRNQKYEIKVTKIQIIGVIDSPNSYPVSSKKHTYEFLREIPHLRSRTNLIGVISRIRNNVFHALQKFLYENEYCWVPTPIITGLNTEGSGSMFRVSTFDINNPPRNENGSINFKKDFFGKEAFLTVSGQLTIESYACAIKKVYNFGPNFRAENSNTTRHLSEFWMLEIEKAFSNLDDMKILSKKMIRYVIIFILNNCKEDMNFLCKKIDKNIFIKLEKFLFSKIICIDYCEAIKILLKQNINFKNSVKYGIDLFSEHEKYLVDKYFNSSIIIQNFPKNLKAFYMRLNDDNQTVSAMDLLVPGIGEIVGGSSREERKCILENRILELELNKEDYSWYIDLRKYGSVPHAGFGLGFERLLSFITGIKNIKDLVPFPRTINNFLC